jgi:hypothetical protein
LPKIASIFELDIKLLEKEYYSEKIAELIYKENDTIDLLNLAQEKAKHLKIKNLQQGNLNFAK